LENSVWKRLWTCRKTDKYLKKKIGPEKGRICKSGDMEKAVNGNMSDNAVGAVGEPGEQQWL
jgi:hypothetical protein